MQTNAISSNLVRYRTNLCETPKHDRILMYTNWMLYQREGSRREGTHRHIHAHVERSSETNPSTPHPRELVRRGRGGETLSAEIGPPPACALALIIPLKIEDPE